MSDGPHLLGFEGNAYETWLARHLRESLCLECDPGLVLCWGSPVPPDAQAAVCIPRDPKFLEKTDVCRRGVGETPPSVARDEALPVVRFSDDVISWMGWLISRTEECEPFQPDAHGRFPRSASRMEALGLQGQPVADLLVRSIRTAMEVVGQSAGLEVRHRMPWPEGKQFVVCLTHDVDLATRRSVGQAVRALAAAGTGLLRTDLLRFQVRMDQAWGFLAGGDRSPWWLFDAMAALEDRRGFRSAFYLLASESEIVTEGRQRVRRYRLSRPEVLQKFRTLAGQGWEIGLHAGYDAHETNDGLGHEWRRLTGLLGPEVHCVGGRSHYLRFFTPRTWRQVASCGMRYDATVGWSKGWGFRSATCWPYQPFDCIAGQSLPIREIGMHLMDTAMTTLDDMVSSTGELLERVKQVGGCACLLFHPCAPRWAPIRGADFLRAYDTVLDMIAREGAWVATPGELVQHLEALSNEGAPWPGLARIS